MSQVINSWVLLGSQVRLYDYSSNQILKISTMGFGENYLECIDSSTCIGVGTSVTHFSKITTIDFLGATTSYLQTAFSSSLTNTPRGLRCFGAVKKCVVYQDQSNVLFDPFIPMGNIITFHYFSNTAGTVSGSPSDGAVIVGIVRDL